VHLATPRPSRLVAVLAVAAFGTLLLPAGRAPASGDPPTAIDDDVIAEPDIDTTVLVLLNDSDPEGDPLTVTIVREPAQGTATVNSDGSVTYLPMSGYEGSDSFDYELCDDTPLCDVATVSLTIGAVGAGGGGGDGGNDGGGGNGDGGGGGGMADTGADTTVLFWLFCSLAALGLALVALAERLEARRGPLRFERFDDGGFLIFPR
jgi:uncharacterized membrane protein YgcG